MSKSSSSSSSGIGLAGLLGVAFIVLKLCHVIDWQWIWVLSPFWIGVAIAVVALIIAVIIASVMAIFNK
jgi:hypothetical protein